METIKDNLNFCKAVFFNDYKNIGIVDELKQTLKYIIENYQKTISVSRMPITLSIIDDVILKINDNVIEIVFEKIHDLRENILHILSFEKLIRKKQLNNKNKFR